MHKAIIIDDNHYNRHIFRIALEHAGYEVVEASDGASGLTTLTEARFDLIILDLQMPGMHGSDVLMQLRNVEMNKTTEVVVITANPEMLLPDVEEQASYVLQKPVDVHFLSTLAQRLKLKWNAG